MREHACMQQNTFTSRELKKSKFPTLCMQQKRHLHDSRKCGILLSWCTFDLQVSIPSEDVQLGSHTVANYWDVPRQPGGAPHL